MKISSFIVILSLVQLPILMANDDAGDGERLLSRQKRKLLFPQFTVWQLSMCLVAQVSSIPSHRVAINTGFQINYQLPFQLSQFYSPIFWARSLTNMSNPMMNFFERFVESEQNDDGLSHDDGDVDVVDEVEEDETTETVTEEPTTTEIETTTTPKPTKKRKHKPKAKRDLTAGQFYSGLRETLTFSGYHEDCLLKSVCELAGHPLHEYEDNFMNEIVHFILTPSVHDSFDSEMESEEKQLFEEAEMMGKSGANCDFLYGSKCTISPLETISKFIHPAGNDENALTINRD